MNELLQKHGCSTIFSIPEGLEELMSDITREVLRWQPASTIDFIANYLSALLITRDQGLIAAKMLDYLCDCRPTVSEHLLQIGLERAQADELAAIIRTEIDKDQLVEENVKEIDILKKVLQRYPLDEEMSVKVCQVARNVYRDYWYKKNSMKEAVKWEPDEDKDLNDAVQDAVAQVHRATEKIQAAYRGYQVRKNVLKHKKKMSTRKLELPGPPLDIALSREIHLGPVIKIKDVASEMFDEEADVNLGLKYDAKKTMTLEAEDFLKQKTQVYSAKISVMELVLSKPSFDVSMISDHEKAKTNPIPEPGEHYEKHHRISFAEEPPVIIKSPDEEALEVPEMPGLSTQTEILTIDPPGNFEVPEELAAAMYIEKKLGSIQSARSVEDDENEDQ